MLLLLQGGPRDADGNFDSIEFYNGIVRFLPRDASAERGYEIACRPSVRLSVRDV